MTDQPQSEPSVDLPAASDPLDAGLAAGFGPDGGPSTTADLTERPGSRIGPYKLLQQIGEGGMGVVFMAEQTEPVRRRVALKVIKPGMDTRQVVARFEAERQALALMDHPNIAKVLDAGATESGRPYFVMELVKGVPITKYCDEHRLTPQQRLELFIPVCQAVQHAHQKGIIHRDLKPSNVLIASYDGKPVPKVIDFGVAKAVGGGLTDKTLFTDFGAVVGTLEYMSPEQAEPNQLDIDTRSDLYALGVLLYELLTGTTPFERKRLRAAALLECLRIIREEEPQKPSTRLSTTEQLPSVAANRGLEPKKLTGMVRGDLDWIVMKCLEKDRNRRYETANGLAMDVQRYLADEPVLASPPSPLYRFRKFTRRHKAGLWTTALVGGTLLLATGGVSWAMLEQAKRVTETEHVVTVALAKADDACTRAEGLSITDESKATAQLVEWQHAEAAFTEAEAALKTGAGTDGLRRRVAEARETIERGKTQAQRKEKLFHDLDEARMLKQTIVKEGFDDVGSAKKYAAAFAAYGLEVKSGDAEQLARQIRAAEPAIRDALLVALAEWAVAAKYAATTPSAQTLWELVGAADDDPWRKTYRAAETAKDRVALRGLAKEAGKSSLPTTSLLLLALSLFQTGEREEALAVLRSARRDRPTDFYIHFTLSYLLTKDQERPPEIELEEAIGCLRAALALRPEATVIHNNLGIDLAAKHQLDEAITEFRKAIKFVPNDAEAHANLGTVLMDSKDQLDEAIAEFKTAIELDPKGASAHNGLGNALCQKNQLDDAIVEYNKAIALDPKQAAAHYNLGKALYHKHQLDNAIAEFHNAIKLNPKHAATYMDLGVVLGDKQQLDDAIAAYRMAIALDPQYVQAYFNLGSALQDKRQLDDAIAAYRMAIALDPKSADVYYNLGNALTDKRQPDDAIAAYRKAIEIKPTFMSAHLNLGNILQEKNQLDDAIAEYEIAIKLDPKSVAVHLMLGRALTLQNRLAGAIAEYRKAIELDPKLPAAHDVLGVALAQNQQLDDAIAEFKKAIALDLNFAVAYNHLGYALAIKNQLDDAIAAYRKATEIDPDLREAHAKLALALMKQGRFAQAQKSHRAALDLVPANDPLRPSILLEQELLQRLAALEPRLADILAGKAEPANNQERLDIAGIQQNQGQYLDAYRRFGETITAEPRLADDLKAWYRYNAACCATLAATGQGKDADKLDDKDRSRLRKRAVEWLRADLALWIKQAASDRAFMQQTLKHWQEDTDLAGIRDKDAVAKLPADEREACQKLWADVAELLKR